MEMHVSALESATPRKDVGEPSDNETTAVKTLLAISPETAQEVYRQPRRACGCSSGS